MKKIHQAALAVSLVICLGIGGFWLYRYVHEKQVAAQRLAQQRHQEELNEGLLYSCVGGDVRGIREMLDKGADVNAREVRPFKDPVGDVIGKGVDKALQMMDPYRSYPPSSSPARIAGLHTALMFAVEHADPEAVQLLLSRGADVNLRAPDNKTALNIARTATHMKFQQQQTTIQLLLQAGAKE